MRSVYLLLFSIIFINSCDKGLSPDLAEEKAGFGGTITFSGEWNPTITETHVVVFKNSLLSVSDFNIFNLSFVSEAIPNGSLEYKYSTNDESALISAIQPGKYSYIAVAQSLRDSITLNREDWIVIGLYTNKNDSTKPGTLNLLEASFADSINIHCDFSNPPPQPPGGIDNLSQQKYFQVESNN